MRENELGLDAGPWMQEVSHECSHVGGDVPNEVGHMQMQDVGT